MVNYSSFTDQPMGECVQDGNTDHVMPSPPDCMQFGIKMFSVQSTIELLHIWFDRYTLIIFNELQHHIDNRDWRRLRRTTLQLFVWGCIHKVQSYWRQNKLANVSQVGRRRGPNRTGTRGNHGQHRSSEDKTGIQGGAQKWRGWLSSLPVNATAFLVYFFDYEAECEWRVAGCQLLALANVTCIRHGSASGFTNS